MKQKSANKIKTFYVRRAGVLFGATFFALFLFGYLNPFVQTVHKARAASVVWVGGTSTNWSDPTNWNTGSVPTINDSVEVTSAGFQPVTLTASASVGSLKIDSGGELFLHGFNFTFASGGAFTNQGTFILDGSETITNITQDTTEGTWQYDGSVPGPANHQSEEYFAIKHFGAVDYYNLTISASQYSVFIYNSDLNIAGSLVVNGGFLQAGISSAKVGVQGQYFNGHNFNLYASQVSDSNINFPSNSKSILAPRAETSGSNFAVRWIGQIIPTQTGDYQIGANASLGFKLWLAGQLVISRFSTSGTALTPLYHLVAGQPLNYQLDYNDNGGAAAVQLMWQPNGGSSTVIPSANLQYGPSYNLSIGANWTGSNQNLNIVNPVAGFSPGMGTVNFYGSGTQQLMGFNQFYNLSKTSGGGETLQFQNIQNILGTLTLLGTSSSNFLTVEGISSGTFIITPENSTNVNFAAIAGMLNENYPFNAANPIYIAVQTGTDLGGNNHVFFNNGNFPAPTITSLTASFSSSVSNNIQITTDLAVLPAIMEYGTDTSYGNFSVNGPADFSTYQTTMGFSLSNINIVNNTVYHYRFIITGQDGLTTTSQDYTIEPHFYAASDLIGQIDTNGNAVFSANCTNNCESVSADGFNVPEFVTEDPINHHRLFVSDLSNNRVLVYQLDSNNNLISRRASYVIGQTGMSGSGSATSQTGLNGPAGMVYDSVHDRLFVGDTGNARVMVYDMSNLSSGMPASYVIGQANFNSGTGGLSQTALAFPNDLSYDSADQLLFVSDSNNNRVLVFDARPQGSSSKSLCGTATTGLSSSTAIPASCVLGQTGFSSMTAVTTQNGMNDPIGIEYDAVNKYLYVADAGNNRVLIFDVRPQGSSSMTLCGTATTGIATSMNASCVLGEGTGAGAFTNSVAYQSTPTGTSADTLHTPTALSYDPTDNLIFVSDAANNRIITFNISNLANGMSSSGVVGATNFTSINDDSNIDNLSMTFPIGVYFDASAAHLYVVVPNDARVMVFNLIQMTSAANLGMGVINEGFSVGLQQSGAQGTASYALSQSSAALPTGLTLSSSGQLSGASQSSGTFPISVVATDNLATIGNFINTKNFSFLINTNTFVGGGGGGSVGGGVAPALPANNNQPSNQTGQNNSSVSIIPGRLVSIGNTVYIIGTDGQKHPFTSAAAFLSYGYSFGNVVPASSAEQSLPTDNPVPPMDGTLINDHGTIYIITSGQRVGFVSLKVFLGFGYKLSRVLSGDTSFLMAAMLISNANQAHPAGTLVSDHGTIYLIIANGKAGISSLKAFTSRGFNLANIVPVNNFDRALPQLTVLN